MIAILNIEQVEILSNFTYNNGVKFNPIQDINDNWVVSEIEYYYCLGLWYLDELQNDLQFITTLQLSEYLPKQQTPLF